MQIISSIKGQDITETGLRATLEAWAGGDTKGFNVEATLEAWREALDELLPEGIGMHQLGALVATSSEGAAEAIAEAIASVDLTEVVVEA